MNDKEILECYAMVLANLKTIINEDIIPISWD